MEQGHIYLYQEIGGGGVTANQIRKELARLNSADSICVHISSPGGEVYEGYTIYNLLKNSGKEINVKIEGLCASIATLIAMAGDTISMTPLSEFMIHNPSGAIQGDAKAMKDAAVQLDGIKKALIKAYKKRTKLAEAELWDMMDKETYLTPKEALKYGFIDEVGERMKAVAYLDVTKQSNKHMSNKLAELIAKMDAKIDNLLNPKQVKNLDATLEDGTPITIEGEEIVEGAAVMVVTQEGASPAPDGQHVLSDGTVLVVVGGKIESFTLPSPDDKAGKDEEMEKMKAENEALKAQLAEAQNKLTESTNTMTNYAEQLTAIKAELEEVKNLTVGATTAQAVNTRVVQTVNKKEHPLDGFAKGLVSLRN